MGTGPMSRIWVFTLVWSRYVATCTKFHVLEVSEEKWSWNINFATDTVANTLRPSIAQLIRAFPINFNGRSWTHDCYSILITIYFQYMNFFLTTPLMTPIKHNYMSRAWGKQEHAIEKKDHNSVLLIWFVSPYIAIAVDKKSTMLTA